MTVIWSSRVSDQDQKEAESAEATGSAENLETPEGLEGVLDEEQP